MIATRRERGAEEMNHYMDFDPYLIREHKHQMPRKVSTLQLAERLREVH